MLEAFELLTTPDALAALRADWDGLWLRSADPFFSQAFAWCWTAWKVRHAPKRHHLACVVGRVDGRVVLIWPFTIARRYGWRVARTLGQVSTEYCQVLVEEGPGSAALLERAWLYARNNLDCDLLTLAAVPSHSALDDIVRRDASTAMLRTLTRQRVSPHDGDQWQAYYKSRPAEKRRQLDRRRRRLLELGEVTFEQISDPIERNQIIDWALDHKLERLSAAGLPPAWRTTSLFESFLKEVPTAPIGEPGFAVFALKINGAVVAAKLCRIGKKQFEMFVSSFAPEYATLAVNQELYARCIEWAFAHGLAPDFRIGNESFKAMWCDEIGEVNYYRSALSAWGRLFNAAEQLRRKRLRPSQPPMLEARPS